MWLTNGSASGRAHTNCFCCCGCCLERLDRLGLVISRQSVGSSSTAYCRRPTSESSDAGAGMLRTGRVAAPARMARRVDGAVMALAPLFGAKHRTRSRAVQCFWEFSSRSSRALTDALWQVAARALPTPGPLRLWSQLLIESYELNETRPHRAAIIRNAYCCQGRCQIGAFQV